MVTGTASGSAEGRVPRAIPWSSVLKDALIISIAPKALPYVQEKVLAWAQETLHTSSMKFSGQQFTVPVDLNQPNTASAKEYSRMLLAYSGTGIKLNNPNYKINFSDYRVAIDMDSELSHLSWSPLASSPNDGVLLDVTMVFKSMLVDVPTVNIQDLANPDFGKWTLTGIRVGNRKRTSAPFQANLQFKVGVSPSGALEVELLKSKTNFDQLRLLLAAQGVEISDINPRLAQLKALPADVLLMLFQDVIIQSAKENVQRALLVDGPRIMNEELKKIPENAKYTTLDYPPQSPKGLTEAEMLNIRFAPTQIRVDKYGILKVQLGAQIRDLVNHYYMRTFRPLRSYNRDLSGKDDLLIEINPDYMNLLLYQSFNRHYFAPMSGKGFELSFFEAPRFTVAPSGQFRVLAEMRLNMPPTIFRVQLNADFLKRSDGNFNMMATGTVKDSFEDRLEPNGVVEWAGNKVVNHLNAKFEDSPYMLQDGLPLPQSVGPLNIDYSRVEFETYNPDYRNNVKGGETGTVEIFGTVR